MQSTLSWLVLSNTDMIGNPNAISFPLWKMILKNKNIHGINRQKRKDKKASSTNKHFQSNQPSISLNTPQKGSELTYHDQMGWLSQDFAFIKSREEITMIIIKMSEQIRRSIDAVLSKKKWDHPGWTAMTQALIIFLRKKDEAIIQSLRFKEADLIKYS